MWSLEVNKYFAAALVAIWVVWISNFAGNQLIPAPETPAASAPGGSATTAATPAAGIKAKSAVPAQPLPVLLAAANTDKGARVAKKCSSCHTFDKGGKNKVGPNLYDIFARTRGATPGFKFSAAMKAVGGKWTFAELDKFIAKPKAYMPKTKMAFSGIKKATDRAALLVYMAKFADTPPSLPTP